MDRAERVVAAISVSPAMNLALLDSSRQGEPGSKPGGDFNAVRRRAHLEHRHTTQ